jgi:hypothetical protein
MILDRFLSAVVSLGTVLHVFDSFQEGSVVLQSGNNVIEVVTRKPPAEVWLSFSDGAIPTCTGNLSKVGYTLSPNGFILYADVNSNVLQVHWTAVFDLSLNQVS